MKHFKIHKILMRILGGFHINKKIINCFEKKKSIFNLSVSSEDGRIVKIDIDFFLY